MKKSVNLGFRLYLFMLLFMMSAIARYTNDFMPVEIAYPRFLEILIDFNREIFGILLVMLVLAGGGWRIVRKTPVGFYWAPIILHLFLSAKLVAYGNDEWYISFFGSLSILGTVYASSKANLQLGEVDQLEKFGITLVSIFIALAALQYFIGGIGTMQFGSRYFFFTAHSNQAGMLWAFCSVTAIFLLIYGNSKKFILKMAMLPVCLLCLFLTDSRGAMLSCAIGVIMIFLIGTGNLQKNIMLYLLALVALAALYFLMSHDIAEFYLKEAARGNTRVDVYENAIDGFTSFPVFGIPYTSGRPVFVENTLLAFMKSAGMVGLLLCAAFYLGAIAILWRSFEKLKKSKDPIPRYFFALFVMMLCASIFESYPINFISTGSFISIFAATYLLRYAQGGSGFRSRDKKKSSVLIAPLYPAPNKF